MADEKENKPNENEHPVFQVLKDSKEDEVIDKVRNYFEVDGVSIEVLDGSGMTPLMHACWKGYVDLAKFLIKQVRKFKRKIYIMQSKD